MKDAEKAIPLSDSMLTQQIHSLYRRLLFALRKNYPEKDIELIRKAFQLANETCESKSGDAGFKLRLIHGLSMAYIVAEEISLGAASVVVALLYKFEENGSITIDLIRKEFGEYTYNLISGLKKISEIPLHITNLQTNNFRELIVSLANDLRVILIRLADLLVNVRNIENFSADEQLKLAYESMHLYAPLAHRIGLYNIKTELEDKALSVMEPESYRGIERNLKESARRRNKFIKEFISPIEEQLNKHKFKFEIKGRTKSIFSIWRKMNKQNVDFEEVYDIFAIRIILDSSLKHEKEDCWRVYSIVTDKYQPNPLRMRDWISVPKSNGYESLHTTVIGQAGNWVEVQIRTKRMDEIAEKGLAAHWKYKGGTAEKGLEAWIGKVRDLLEAPEQEPSELMDDFRLSLSTKEIFVFTPKGDLKRLPKGATVLDFAFEIHTGVGSTCIGAKVNGKNVPIRYELNNGDKVEIFTSKNQKPKQDWLDFAITTKAKNKIKQALKEEIFKEAEQGKETIKRRLRNWKIAYNDENIRKLITHYKLKTAVDLYYQIAEEKIDLAEIKEILTKSSVETASKTETQVQSGITEYKPEVIPGKTIDYLIIDNKLGNVDYKLAKCCNPIPGDPIFGFVTINEGIKVHRISCPNAAQLIDKYGYRIVNAHWSQADLQTFFEAGIRINGIDEMGVVSRLTDVISKDLKVNMRSISIESMDGLYEGVIRILVRDIKHLDVLINRIMKVKGVLSASRIELS